MASFLSRQLNPSERIAQPRLAGKPSIAFSSRQLALVALPLMLLLFIPLLALVVRTPPDMVLRHIGSHEVMHALMLSLCTSTASTLIVIVLGTPLAYLLVRQRFPGRRLLEVLVDLPTVLPPAVAGLALLMAFGRRGLLGGTFSAVGVELPFSTAAVMVAQVFVAASLYIKTAGVGLAAINSEIEQAAALDGACPRSIFRHITLPLAWRGMLGGAALAWTRALGEFGATIIFAGNFPGRTQTMPLLVYLSFEIDLEQALTLALILLLICFGILMGVRALLRDQDQDHA